MKGMKLVKHMKGIRTRQVEIRRVQKRTFMTFNVFMPFIHGGSRG